jgi:hypothetical protein
MESVTYEGDYPCMHNHPISHSDNILASRRKIFRCTLLNLGVEGRKGKHK